MALALVTDLTDPACNAYTDLAPVQALAAYRGAPGVAFLALTDDEAMAAIASMAADIDSSDWDGEKLDELQPMAWGRTGTDYSGTDAPPAVVKANREGAIAIGANFAASATTDTLNPTVDRLKRTKVGPIESEFFAPATIDVTSAARLPAIVQRLIAPYLRSTVATGYGTGTAVRGS